MTFREVRMKTIRAAQNLLKRGYKPRQVFGFMAQNSDNLLPIFLSAICLGCPVVPLNTSLTKDEIVRIFSKTKPTLLFCDAKSCAQMNEALRELNWNLEIFTLDEQIVNCESVESLLIETGEEDNFVYVSYRISRYLAEIFQFVSFSISPICLDMVNDIAGIFSSSGTTGPSKCKFIYQNLFELFKLSPSIGTFTGVSVSYSHSAFSRKLHEGAVLCLVSIYWTVGIIATMECIYSGAARIITNKPFTPKYFLELIEKYKASVLICSPFRTVACLKSDVIAKMDLSSLNKIYYCGNHMPSGLIGEIKRYFKNAELFSNYGNTEIGGMSNCSLDEVFTGYRLYNDCLVKIVDDYGNRCGPNVNGEICVKKKYKFLGYFGDSKATAAAVDDEGFFRTGDIGHFDDSGAMFIEDRKKNILQVFHFGDFILPNEIEEVLISLPDVEEACVVGIPLLKLSGPMIPAAVIARKTNSILNQNDIFNFVAGEKIIKKSIG